MAEPLEPIRPAHELKQPSALGALRSLAPTILITGVLPFVLYQVLTGRGVAVVPALVVGSAFPLAFGLLGWARTRRLEILAVISLAFIVIGALASLVSGSARFTLVKESFFTGAFGLIFFASLLAPKPLMFYVVQEFVTGGDPDRLTLWHQRWQYPGFRHSMRVMTVIWGTSFVADALIRTVLVFILSTSVFLVVSQVLFYAMFAATFSLTLAYGRRAQRRGLAHP